MNQNSPIVSPNLRPQRSVSHADAGNYPLARLLQLVMLLQAERCPNARELAEACEVSRRTIYRDFSTLAAAGIAVHYVPDRQGYELARNVFLQPTQLHEKEALALLLVSRCWDGSGAVGLVRQARIAVDKVLQGLPQELRSRLGNCSELLSEGAQPEGPPEEACATFDRLLLAMTQRRQVRLWYREEGAERAELETTKLSLYRLPRIQGDWLLVGRSSFHRRVVAVRLSWIERIESTTDGYAVPPRFQLRRFLEQARGEAGSDSIEIVLKLRGLLATRIDDLPWPGRRRLITRAADGVEIAVQVVPSPRLAATILSLGDEAEVIGPEDLRDSVGKLAVRLARRYESPEESTPISLKSGDSTHSGGVGG